MKTWNLILAAALAAGLYAGQAWAIDSAGSGYWDVGATWSGGNVPTSADDVVILAGHTVTNRDLITRSASNLTIQAGGVLTHTVNEGTEAYKVILNIVSNLTIEAGGAINVDGRGYSAGGGGPGAGPGAGYGGKGGEVPGWGQTPGTTYGSITAPTNCGSKSSSGTFGGGAVILTVGGATAVNGLISAGGVDSGSYYAGAGGSVFLTTGTLTGSGTLRANGGQAPNGAAGGGGRVAVILTASTDFGGVARTAYGGVSASGGAGGGGTIYLEKQGDAAGRGKLIVDYNNIAPYDRFKSATLQNGMAASSHEFSEIVLTNGALYMLDANDTLDITNATVRASPVNRFDGIYIDGGALTVPAAFSFTDYSIGIGANSTFNPTTSLTVGNLASLIVDKPHTLNCPVTIASNGVMSHLENGLRVNYAEANKLNLTIRGNLDIQAGGEVNVDGMGYAGGYGPGASTAGAHGGQGGKYSADQSVGGTYGSITSPTNCGSGGGAAGGGAVCLNVTGTTTVNGAVSASGVDGGHYRGSGGSVFITTGSLSGSGTLRANGGAYDSGACGGGGRVAVILTNSTDLANVKVQAFGGYSSYLLNRGSAGTVYRQSKDQAAGQGILTVDNNNQTTESWSATLIGSQVLDTAVGTVIVTNAAKLTITNQTLTIRGDLNNCATFRGDYGSTVAFAGTNAATISGTNTFHNFTSTNLNCTQESEAKRLNFQEARTNTVNGVLTLTGVRVDSIGGGSTWGLKANPALTHSVSNVWAGRSDASSGSQITAYDSTNMGGNVKWVFTKSGITINTWLGATDSDWTQNANWSEGRPTIETDLVVIPNGCSYYPLLDSTRRVRSLSISNAASMSLNGKNLTVDTDLTVAGMLTATGSETVTVRGDVDFAGGAFTAAVSTVVLDSTNAQTVVTGGIAFYNLTVTNPTSVAFSDAVTATNIVNQGTPLAFGGSVTAAVLFQSHGANVVFGGPVTAGTFRNSSGDIFFPGVVNAGLFRNTDGDLRFGDALTASSFYSENGDLVFTGAVNTVAFTNLGGNLTLRQTITSDRMFCAPGNMQFTFEAGMTNTIGTLEWYGCGGYPIVLHSSSAGNAWHLKVTNSHVVRQVDVQDSDADSGQTIYPLASTNSGNNSNWVFDPAWQTWVGTASGTFTDGNNWTPPGAPDGTKRLLIDGYYANAPVLSGVATAVQVMVGGITSATLTVNGQLAVLGDVTVIPNGTITHSANSGSSEANKLTLTVGANLTIYGQINVDGKGYAANQGPGTAAAGAHGGQGGEYDADRKSVGTTYGSITSPTNCGSGGWSGAGGGAVRLNVTGTTTVNGTVSARGVDGGHYRGSGGSVFITTGSLSGSGTVRANGGSENSACGGGGRVAVILTNSTEFAGVTIQASGGYGASLHNRGSAGTVYREHKDQAPGQGTLTVDNNGQPTADWSTTRIGPLVTDTTVGTVIITNSAKLAISNAVLTVQGDWINKATFLAQTNSTVDFAGAAAATVTANNAFYNFTCTNAGKTLVFEAGRTNTVNGLLRLGASHSGQSVTLQSTVDGSWSYLTLTPGGTQQIARVSVKDNNAGGGQTLLANVGSANGGNNINWQFPPSGTMFMVK